MKKSIFLSFIIFSFLSCSNNEKEFDELSTNDFRGKYKISSISTNLPLDLNNDDIQSTNYLQEISLPYRLHNGQIVNYGFNTNKPQFETTAKPQSDIDNGTRFLQIYIPKNEMTPLYVGNNSFVNISLGINAIYLNFLYNVVNGQIVIESDPFDLLTFHNVSDFKIMRIDKDNFEIKFRKQFYDFKNEIEVNTETKVVFERI